MSGRRFFVAAVSFMMLAAGSGNASAQENFTKNAKDKGIELIQKIEKEYPNVHGEVEEYFNLYQIALKSAGPSLEKLFPTNRIKEIIDNRFL